MSTSQGMGPTYVHMVCVEHSILLQWLKVSFGLDDTILHWFLFFGPHTADRVLRAVVRCLVGRLWCSARLCAWAATVHALYSRASLTGRATRSHHAPVCRRLPTLH